MIKFQAKKNQMDKSKYTLFYEDVTYNLHNFF
jgi:hypothetical protein